MNAYEYLRLIMKNLIESDENWPRYQRQDIQLLLQAITSKNGPIMSQSQVNNMQRVWGL